jgi:hypothetical protein
LVLATGCCLLFEAEIVGAVTVADVAGAPGDEVAGFAHGSSAHKSFAVVVDVFFVSCGAAAIEGAVLVSRLSSARGGGLAPRPIVAADVSAVLPQDQSSAAERPVGAGCAGGARTLWVLS